MKNNTKTRAANRKLQSKCARLSAELARLRFIANTLNHHGIDYNKWALAYPKHLKYVDAQELLRLYFRENPFEEG